ncbi:MAG: hypothetical protein H0T46_33255 [Deltaproteobacteria bacterium]|nr:hypothetical protein [Deltaproteobacteria bacterium]
MRVALSLLLLIVLGCGPSSREVRTAKLAEYNAQTAHILDIATQVVQRSYKVADIDPKQATIVTGAQWYNEDGGRRGIANEGNGDYLVNMRGGDIELSLEVRVLGAAGGRVIVTVQPRTRQLVSGSPQPRSLAPDDPNLPPWVKGRVDTLAVDIYNAARQFAHAN